MKTPAQSLDLAVVPVTNELKESDLEHVSAGLDKIGQFASIGNMGMNFPTIRIPNFFGS